MPDLCSVHQHVLYHALEHHDSSPELTFPFCLSYSPNASNYLVRLPHYLSHLRLVSGSLVEGVTQVLELAHSFYLAFFPLPLALLILPLSLVEHHHFRLLNIHFQLFLPHILSQVPHHFFHLSLTLCHNHHVVRKRHTSLSVLISFISFSSLSLFCFFFSLHLSLCLLFTSRNLILSILFLLHSLNHDHLNSRHA
jgi:hypothetical protein